MPFLAVSVILIFIVRDSYAQQIYAKRRRDNEEENNLETGFFVMIQRQTLVQDEKQQEQYEASVEVEDAEETADAAQETA